MRSCPSCDRSLPSRATACECGWSEKPAAGKLSPLLSHALDPQCQWEANAKRCRYPVNFFESGQTRGFCRWHKRCGHDGQMGADIVEQSHRDNRRDYEARTHLETYGIRVDLANLPKPEQSATVDEARIRCMETMRRLNFTHTGSRDWAYAIFAKHKGGDKVSPLALANAMQSIRSDPGRNQTMEAFAEAA